MRYPATLHHPHVTFIITFELGLLLLLTAAVEADMYVSGAVDSPDSDCLLCLLCLGQSVYYAIY